MITVEKNGIITEILEVFKDKYLSSGWKVIERQKKEIKDEAETIISNAIDSKRAANNRRRDLTRDKQAEAAAIVARELRKKEDNIFTDGLIKE